MRIFSKTIAEVSTEVVALLPSLNESTGFDKNCVSQAETAECDPSDTICSLQLGGGSMSTSGSRCNSLLSSLRYKAQFLQSELYSLQYGVDVVCAVDDEMESLKVVGSWEKLAAVYAWLSNWAEKAQTAKVEVIPVVDFPRAESCSNATADCINYQMQAQKQNERRVTRSSAKRSISIAEEVCRSISRPVETSLKSMKVSKKASRSEAVSLAADEAMPAAGSACLWNECDNDLSANLEKASTKKFGGATTRFIDPLVRKKKRSMKVQKQMVKCKILTSQVLQSSESNVEYRCDLCDYTSKKERYLLFHKLRVHGKREHQCSVCHHSFGVLKDLNQHLKFHNERFFCEHCGKTLKSKYAIALHIARIHNGAAPRPVKHYLCTLCGKMCRNKTDYTAHRNKEHLGIRPFHCNVCNTGFFARANLRAHEQIHSDARTFKCKHCDKAFKQRQGLRIHLAVHAVDRPYKCAHCHKSFTQRSALVRHARTHTSSRPYVCPRCPSTFNDCSILRRHLVGIHKVNNAKELKDCVKTACAEARLSSKSETVDRVCLSALANESEQPLDADQQTNVVPQLVKAERPAAGQGASASVDTIVMSVDDVDLSREAANGPDNFISALPYANLLMGVVAKTDSSIEVDIPSADPMYILSGYANSASFQVSNTSLMSMFPDASQYVLIDDSWRTWRATGTDS